MNINLEIKKAFLKQDFEKMKQIASEDPLMSVEQFLLVIKTFKLFASDNEIKALIQNTRLDYSKDSYSIAYFLLACFQYDAINESFIKNINNRPINRVESYAYDFYKLSPTSLNKSLDFLMKYFPCLNESHDFKLKTINLSLPTIRKNGNILLVDQIDNLINVLKKGLMRSSEIRQIHDTFDTMMYFFHENVDITLEESDLIF